MLKTKAYSKINFEMNPDYVRAGSPVIAKPKDKLDQPKPVNPYTKDDYRGRIPLGIYDTALYHTDIKKERPARTNVIMNNELDFRINLNRNLMKSKQRRYKHTLIPTNIL